MSIIDNIQQHLSKIRQYEIEYGRPQGVVKLLAVSKAHSVLRLKQAVAAGQQHFGESYLQEAQQKMEALSNEGISWHYIGKVQRNKIKRIAQQFSWVHGVTSVAMAAALSQERPQQLGLLNVFIQVNIDKEPTKSGASGADVVDIAREVMVMENLKLQGLMTIPAPQEHFSEQLLAFKKVTELQRSLLADGIDLKELSMGMSRDYRAAIAAGSTMVRLGSALFGQRL